MPLSQGNEPPTSDKPQRTTHVVDPGRINRVSNRLVDRLDARLPTVENELGLILTYARISDGVKLYPEHLKQARVNVLIQRLSTVMADAVVAVGALSSDDPELAAMAATSSGNS